MGEFTPLMARDGRDRWREVQALLDAVLDLPGNERETFLRRACGDRPALLVEVTELLRACTTSSGFLDEPVSLVAAPLLAEVMPEDAHCSIRTWRTQENGSFEAPVS